MHRFHSLPIRRKLTLIILAICGLTLSMAGSAIAIYEVYDFRRALARDATVLANVVASNVSGTLAFDDEAAAAAVLQALQSEEQVLGAALYKGDGALFVDYRRPGRREALPVSPGPDRAHHHDIQGPLARGGPAYRDAWAHLNPGIAHPPTFCLHDAAYAKKPYCCDFAFVSEDLLGRVRRVTVDLETRDSDHQPVLVELA